MRKGGYLMINGYACKVVNMSTAKTGKHGGAKVLKDVDGMPGPGRSQCLTARTCTPDGCWYSYLVG